MTTFLDAPSLYVDQQSITAVLGGSVTVTCHYAKRSSFKWCKLGSKCISKSGEMDGMEVIISTQWEMANVTLKELKEKHSGWYFCQNGGFQMPVNLTVMREITTYFLVQSKSLDSQLVSGYFDGQVTIKCKYNGPGEKTWCKVDGTCTSGDTKVSIDTHVAGVFAVTMTGLQTQDIGWYWCGLGNLQMPVFLSLATRPTTSKQKIITWKYCTTVLVSKSKL
uniref:Immunoglobulin domain-containing protein n=1 Tax=Periophthalmus magnuspinnatus TaxID=409849 RepID=A0A3B3ZRY5_9GOBI